MPLETDSLNQKAVLWTSNGYDDYGEAKVDAAIEIDTRWELTQTESLNANGDTILLSATVVVDRDIPIGSAMWLGKLVDVASTPVGLRTVLTFSSVPDIHAIEYRRTVGLGKLSDELPTLA